MNLPNNCHIICRQKSTSLCKNDSSFPNRASGCYSFQQLLWRRFMGQNKECVKSLIGFRRFHSNKSFQQSHSFPQTVVRPQEPFIGLTWPDLGTGTEIWNLNTSSKMHCRAMLRHNQLVTWPLIGQYPSSESSDWSGQNIFCIQEGRQTTALGILWNELVLMIEDRLGIIPTSTGTWISHENPGLFLAVIL